MAELLTNVAVADGYTNAATLGPTLGITQLVFQVFNEPVYARFFKPPVDPESNRQPTLDPTEHYFPVGTLLSVDGAAGVQFRNGIAGQPATINAQIGFAGDPIFDFQSSGLFSAAVLTLSFLHNNALQGAESTLDFEDSAQIVWTVTDTPGTKESVSAAFVTGSVVTSVFGRTGAVVAVSGDYTAAQVTNAADKASASQQVFTGAISTTQLTTTSNSGVVAQSASGSHAFRNFLLAGDTQPAFEITGAGLLEWGPGGASALDTTLGRLAANVVGSASDALSTGPLNNGRSTIGAFLETGTGRVLTTGASPGPTSSMFATAIAGDVQWRWTIDSTGAMTWGTGASVGDTTLFRSAAVPPSSGQVGLASSQAFYSTNTTGGFVYAAATNNSAFLSFFLAGDSQPAFKIFTQGAMTWGVGGSTAADIELARAALTSGGLNIIKLFNINAGAVGAGSIQVSGNFYSGFKTTALAATATYATDATIHVQTITQATGGGTVTMSNPTNPPDSALHSGELIIIFTTSATAGVTFSWGTQWVGSTNYTLPATIAAATVMAMTFVADYTTGSILWRRVG